MSSSVAEILAHEGIRDFERDLRTFSEEELREQFGAASSGRILITRVIKNVIWQVLTQVREGQTPGIDGNLRTFYYMFVKPPMARIPGALYERRDPYDTMLEVFVELVEEHRLFRYSELDLTDENWEHRKIGERHPGIVVVAEKVGFWRWLKRAHRDLGISVMALGGTPSLLSSEYFLAELAEHTDISETQFLMLGIVDWDPAGFDIARAQLRQFESLGMGHYTYRDLVRLESYEESELEIFRYPLSRGQSARNARWVEETGGVGGEPWGVECDSMPRDRLFAILLEELQAYGVS